MPNQAFPDNWYAEERLLYYGLPVKVSFTPPNAALAASIWEYLDQVDDRFNDYRDTSEIGRINRQMDKSLVPISAELAHALELAREVYTMTDGAFDITIRPLRQLWKDAVSRDRFPPQEEIAQVLEQCGFRHVNVSETTLRVDHDHITFDLGGIIKGIVVDNVMRRLKENDIAAGMVQLGGDMAAFGFSPHFARHVIGIQHPTDLSDIWTRVKDPGTGIGVSTSGNYRNPAVIAGREINHIIDPRTGFPVSTDIVSVSVVFPDIGKNWLADGLATASMVLGPDAAIPLITNAGGECLILIRVGNEIKEYKSPGWERLVVK